MTTQPTRSTSPYEAYAASNAENYERHFVPIIGLPFAQRLVQTAQLARGERVLDVACGTGISTRLAAGAVGPTGIVAGLDANRGMLEVARTASAEDIHWYEAPAEDIPLPDDSFDVVLCSMGLQFFSDRVKALTEMRRVLAPGGRVVVGTPGPTPPLMRAIDRALNEHLGPGASMFVHAVFSLHAPDEARRLLDSAGFHRIHLETDTLPLRLPPPAEFFWLYVHITPLAAMAADLDEAARVALERDVVEHCQPFVGGDASVMELGVMIATGHVDAE